MSVKLKATNPFWHGFNEAIELVKYTLEQCERSKRLSIDQWAHLMNNINIDVDKYKKGI